MPPARQEVSVDAEPQKAGETPQGPQGQAAECFDRGLDLVRMRSYEPALREWEQAAEMAPQNRTYRINLKRLRELISSRVTSLRSEHGHQERKD